MNEYVILKSEWFSFHEQTPIEMLLTDYYYGLILGKTPLQHCSLPLDPFADIFGSLSNRWVYISAWLILVLCVCVFLLRN